MAVQVPLAALAGPNVPNILRSSTITVGTVQIQNIGLTHGLDVDFKVVRTLKPTDPNTCDLKIYNLSPSSRTAIEQAAQQTKAAQVPGQPGSNKVIPVRIDAGFVNQTSTIFLGELRSAESVTEGTNIVTELSTGDGDDALVLQRINQTFGIGTSPVQVVKALLSQMGVGQGNLGVVQGLLSSVPMFTQGAAVKGNAAERLTAICISAGLEFSIQAGQAQFLSRGQPLAGQAYLLAPNTGLYGSPTVDTKGVLQAECAMLPGLAPGVPVQVQAAYVQGVFRITSITTTGSTAGEEWSHAIEGKRYGTSP